MNKYIIRCSTIWRGQELNYAAVGSDKKDLEDSAEVLARENFDENNDSIAAYNSFEDISKEEYADIADIVEPECYSYKIILVDTPQLETEWKQLKKDNYFI